MSKQNSCQGFHHKKENYIQLLDLTWPKQNSCTKNPQPPITFLMVRPLLTFKPDKHKKKINFNTLLLPLSYVFFEY